MAARDRRHPPTRELGPGPSGSTLTGVIRTPPVLSTTRLDALPWAHTSGPFRAIAHDFMVRTCDPALGEYLGAVLDPFSVDGRTGDGNATSRAYSVVDRGEATKNRYALYFGRERLALTPSGSFIVATLLWHVNRRAVESGDGFVLVHAGAVEWEGRAALFPAPMESGKTTLVAGLVRAGTRYLSDEAAAIDPETLQVHPFPKSLTVGAGSWEVLADLTPRSTPRSPAAISSRSGTSTPGRSAPTRSCRRRRPRSSSRLATNVAPAPPSCR